MKRMEKSLDELLGTVPEDLQREMNLCFDISDRIEDLMCQKGLSKKQFADAIGKRPCEVTKWLSGQHNFTIATLAKISTFFGSPIIEVV